MGLAYEAAFLCIKICCNVMQAITSDRGPLQQAIYGVHTTEHAIALPLPVRGNGTIAADALLHSDLCVPGRGTAVVWLILVRVGPARRRAVPVRR